MEQGQLKFRAWHNKNKQWVLGTNKTPFSIVGEVTVFDMLRGYNLEQFNDIEITQFTGLKDTNDKECFQGDIITFLGNCNETGTPIPPNGKNYIVEWLGSGLFACPIEKSFSSTERDIKGVGHTEFIILGNIYENQDLIADK